MKKLLVFIFLLLFFAAPAQISRQQYKEDFEFFWTTIRDNYCYWNKKQTDWAKVKALYLPLADTITQKSSFVALLEKVFYELYDHHASLSTNTMESQRLVPSGADIWAEYINGKPIITEVRLGFGADNAGLRAGMELIAFNGIQIAQAIKPFMPQSLKKDDVEAKNYALRVLLAGKHSENRQITAGYQGKEMVFYPDQPVNLLKTHQYTSLITSKLLNGNTGYICINNRLWDNALIPAFDSVLQSLRNTKALILDLRSTPSGGNTTVARAILGSFILKEGFYQKHEFTAEEMEFGIKRSWMEIVSPRKFYYSKPMVVLVDHWTGSVGEGIAIGFDALKRAVIIGTPMARLNGANYSFTMPHTGIGFSFPAEKLFHVNGMPRENFTPAVTIDMSKQKPGTDSILQTALSFLNQPATKKK
ncbi:MAG: S41 family peptidase [Chitinophagaceae bacterium]